MRLPVLLATLRRHGVVRYKHGDVEIEMGGIAEAPRVAGKPGDLPAPTRDKPPSSLELALREAPPIPGDDEPGEERN